MDIPNTGAIFTLGKSHLAENTQSYFYIKNDPVKRVISGPHQSAVICESGRLFVWGENHHGQLGIGGSSSNHNNNNNNGGGETAGDIVTKPTCVKSLKTLGLKIADVAFGNDWAVMLTHSNELFFTGRNIFHDDKNVTQNFNITEVAGEKCAIIRKPFRLEEFDDCLSHSEEEENFVTLLAGNEHFAVMTSSGRLIGWGSNASHQLGLAESDDEHAPLEVVLDAPIQQFACGPESTLVLTESGNLYLTGKLNDLVFPQFTELQKNLSSSEQIIFMHISKASEIYIVTNAGSIYRSFEVVRNKNLIFQRFYDYESEENGPIWKLLRGSSFYTVLTKANKFYTTFSESGHHLKTFREISKFKNLRLLDMAVGDQHILVHGIPRSSTLSATVGSGGEHRYMSRSFVQPDMNGNVRGRSGKSLGLKNGRKEGKIDEQKDGGEELVDTEGKQEEERKETPKPNTPVHLNGNIEEEDLDAEGNAIESVENVKNLVQNGIESLNEEDENQASVDEKQASVDNSKEEQLKDKAIEVPKETKNIAEPREPEANQNPTQAETPKSSSLKSESVSKSPSESVKSRKSARSIKFEKQALEKSISSDKLPRPRTPYPDSSSASTPQTAKKAIRNFSYEAAMEHDAIENITPELHDSMEDIAESSSNDEHQTAFKATIKNPTPPYEEDEELTLEIETTVDELDQTVINEIRFINNGVDVTPSVEGNKMLGKIDSVERRLQQTGPNEIQNEQKSDLIAKVGEAIDDKEAQALEARKEVESNVKESSSDTKFQNAVNSVESAAQKVATGARDAVDSVGANAKKAASGARDAAESLGNNAKKAASDAGQAMGALGHKAIDAANEAKHAMGNAMSKVADNSKHAMDTMGTKISHEMQSAKENLSSLVSSSSKTDKSTRSSEHDDEDATEAGSSEGTSKEGLKTTVGEDDERTTASVNSNHTSAGNPFDSGNPFEGGNPFDNELDNEIEQTFPIDKQALGAAHSEHEEEKSKGKVRQFFSDMRSKSKGMSCRNEKAIRIEDEPPRYTPVEQQHLGSMEQVGNNSNHDNTSKVCTIL